MEAAKRVAKNTGILYARLAITVFISLYSTRLILAALGVDDFGLFGLVGGVISMLGFLNNAMATATQRFVSIAQGTGDFDKVRQIFNMSSLLHWGVSVLVFFLLEGAGYIFFHGFLNIAPNRVEEAYMVYQFMVASTLMTIISVPYDAVIVSHENMKVEAILSVFEAILKLGIAFYVTYTSFDHLVAYGFLMAILSMLMLIFRRIYCHIVYPECNLKIILYFNKTLLKDIAQFAGLSFLACFSSMISVYGQTVILNLFFGTRVISAQNIATQISGQLRVFSFTLSKAINPVITKYEGAGERLKMIKVLIFGSKIGFLLQAILYIPFIIEMPTIMHYWIKNVPNFAIIFCRMLLINNLIGAFAGNLKDAISAVGKIRNYQIFSSILYISTISLSYLFFKLGFPPHYVYVSMFIFTILHVINNLFFASKIFQLSLKDYWKNFVLKFFIVCLITISISICPLLLFTNELIILASVFMLAGIVFLSCTWFIGFNTEERELIEKLVFKFQSEIRLAMYKLAFKYKK